MKMTSKGFRPTLQYAQLSSGAFVVHNRATGKTHLITNLHLQKNLQRIAKIKKWEKKRAKERKKFEKEYSKEKKEHPDFSNEQIEQIVKDHERQ